MPNKEINDWMDEINSIRDVRNEIKNGNFDFLHDEKLAENARTILMKYPEFMSSPASAKYHGAYEGGLFDHSFAVFLCAIKLAPIFKIENVDAIACIFHDLCKVGSYGFNDKDNKYFYKDNLGLPHGSESLRRIMKCGVQLSSEGWEFAVAYHMGAFNANSEETINFGKMCEKHPEVLLLHTADMMASKLMSL